MLIADLHTHTCCSHGKHTALAMAEAALERGVSVLGFSEHAPRPDGYEYPKDYRDRLLTEFPGYVADVRELAERFENRMEIRLGVEFDYLPGFEPFIEDIKAEYGFDYAIGSVHFLGHWGFDFAPSDWKGLATEEAEAAYADYFRLMGEMGDSGLFDFAAHPDLVKIFSIERFQAWRATPAGMDAMGGFVQALAGAGMAMELSSAGLRKACREIYPCPELMRLAREADVPIVLGSDAHRAEHLAYGFDELRAYAKGFGYETALTFAGRGPAQTYI